MYVHELFSYRFFDNLHIKVDKFPSVVVKNQRGENRSFVFHEFRGLIALDVFLKGA